MKFMTVRSETDRTNLIARLNKLSGDEARRWGKMNVNQMMSHLVQSGNLPFEVDLPNKSTFAFRTFVKPLVLYVLPIPKGVKTSPAIDQQENGRKPVDFNADRGLVIDLITKLGDLPADQECVYHPMFGP